MVTQFLSPQLISFIITLSGPVEMPKKETKHSLYLDVMSYFVKDQTK